MKLVRKITSFSIYLLFYFHAIGQEERDLLSSYLNSENQQYELGPIDYQAFDKEEMRLRLKSLPNDVQKRLIADADELLDYSWPVIPATTYLDYVRSGDREGMQEYYRKRLNSIKSLVLAELLENEGRFMDGIINACWAICEQSTWVLSAHLYMQEGGVGIPNVDDPSIDLGAGEIAASLAWTHYFFREDFNEINPLLGKRIPYEINKRIIQPYLERDDFWWLGFDDEDLVNNWNPWVNYNVVLSTVLIGEDVKEDIKQKVVAKSLRSVDQFINYYKEDGASEEGPNYWSHAGGKMLEYLELIKNISNGKIAIGDQEIIRDIGRYIMEVHIFDDYYVNFADSSVKAHPDAGIVYRYGKYIDDQELLSFASFLARKGTFYENPVKGSLDIALHNLAIYEEMKSVPSAKENKLSFWFSETEIAVGRTHKDAQRGFFFAAKGGYNAESHNHNDAGTFILYHQGEPLIIDIGVETYTAKTFSDQRYDIWTMQSDFHNLPKINGESQADGKEFKASDVEFTNRRAELNFSLNICQAYPNEAQCEYWNRSYKLKRKNPELIISDEFKLNAYHDQSAVHFMAALPPEIQRDGRIKLRENFGKSVYLLYSSDKFKAAVEEYEIEDERLLNAWQREKLYRIVLTPRGKELGASWTFRIIESGK